jgi:hypothetical protein
MYNPPKPMRYALYAFTAFFALGLLYCILNVRTVHAVPFWFYIAGTTLAVGLCSIERALRTRKILN